MSVLFYILYHWHITTTCAHFYFVLIFNNVLFLLIYTDFYITFNKLQALVQGHTEIPGGECHSCRNWARNLN